MAGDSASRREMVLSAVGNGLLQMQSLLLFLLLSRRLFPDDLGAYRLISLLVLMGSLLAAAGSPEALLRALGLARRPEDRARAFAACLGWLLCSAPLLAGGAGALAWGAGHLLHRPVVCAAAGSIALLALCVAAQPYASPVVQAGMGGYRLCLFAVFQSITGLAWIVLLVHPVNAAPSGTPLSGSPINHPLFGAWIGTHGGAALPLVLAVAAAASAPSLVAAVAVCLREAWSARRCFLTPIVFWREAIRPALNYGGPIAAGAFLYLLAYQADHLVASGTLHPLQYGIYAAGAWQLPLGSLIQQTQRQTLLPRFTALLAHSDRTEFRRTWLGLVRPGAWLGAFLFWGVFAGAPDGLAFLLGPGYAGAVPVFRVYSLLLLTQMTAFCLPLWAAGQTRVDALAGMAFLVINLAVGSWLSDRFGLIGPALGVVGGLSAWTAIVVAGAARVLRLRIRDLVPIGPQGLGILGLGVTAAVSWSAASAIAPASPGGRLVLFAGIYSVLSGTIWYGLRRRSRREKPEQTA